MLLQGSRMPAAKICCYRTKRFVRFLHLFILRYALTPGPGQGREKWHALYAKLLEFGEIKLTELSVKDRMNQFSMLLDNPLLIDSAGYYASIITCVFSILYFLYKMKFSIHDVNYSSMSSANS